MSNALDTPYGSINVYLQSQQATETVLNASVPINANSNKIWYLNTPITLPRPDVKMLCAITDFQCAYSWYIIRLNINDHVAVLDPNLNGAATFTLIVPEGNYSATQFVAALNTDYTTVPFSGTAFGLPQVPGWSDQVFGYDATQNRIYYVSPTIAMGPAFTLFNKAGGTTADTEVGIEGQPSVIPGGAAPTEPIYYPNMCDFAGIPYVYVIAPTLGLENRNSLGNIDLTVAKVPVQTQPLGFVYMPVDAGNVHLHLQDIIIKKIQIVLQDDEGNELDLHGIGWGLTLTIHFQYLRMPIEPRMVLKNGQVPLEGEFEDDGVEDDGVEEE